MLDDGLADLENALRFTDEYAPRILRLAGHGLCIVRCRRRPRLTGPCGIGGEPRGVPDARARLLGKQLAGTFGECPDIQAAGLGGTQRVDQPGQTRVGLGDELQYRAGDRADALDDPVEQILHRPGELADIRGSHQAAAALEGVKGTAHGDQGVAVTGVGVPPDEAVRQYLDDLAGLVDENLEDIVVHLHLRDLRSRWRRRDDACGHVLAGLVGGTLQRTNAVFGEFQQRVVIGLQSDDRLQVVLEAHQRVGKRIEGVRRRRELRVGKQR